MPGNGLQLPGLARSRDPVNIPLDRIEIGAYLTVPQSADPGFFRVDVHHDSAARFILIVSESVNKAAVNLDGVSRRDAD